MKGRQTRLNVEGGNQRTDNIRRIIVGNAIELYRPGLRFPIKVRGDGQPLFPLVMPLVSVR